MYIYLHTDARAHAHVYTHSKMINIISYIGGRKSHGKWHLGAVVQQVGDADVAVQREARARGRALGVHQLLPRDSCLEDGRTETAVLFGAVNAEQTVFSRL